MFSIEINYYTDGACSGNPGPGGWAVVKEINGETAIKVGNSKSTTNNIMELTAFLNALKLAELEYRAPQAILIERWKFNFFTDSAYISNCFKEKWYEYWQMHNWTTKSKQPVKNKELWQEILNIVFNLSMLPDVDIFIEKVEGHSNNTYNNMADKYAVAARKEIK